MTLANYIEIKKYNLGDIILREGDEPQYFYILQKGRCEIVKEEVVVRKRYFDENKSNIHKRNRLNFSKPSGKLSF